MQIDDSEVFKEYHKERSLGTPFTYFIKSRHIRLTEKSFLRKYNKWRHLNHIEWNHPTYFDYLNWILDHFGATREQRDYSYYVKGLLKGGRYEELLHEEKYGFTELVLATSIFSLTYGATQNLLETVGITDDPVARCRRFLFELIKEPENSKASMGFQSV